MDEIEEDTQVYLGLGLNELREPQAVPFRVDAGKAAFLHFAK